MGDRVIAIVEYTAWAEAVVTPAKYCFKMPTGARNCSAFCALLLQTFILLIADGPVLKIKRLRTRDVARSALVFERPEMAYEVMLISVDTCASAIPNR